MRRRQITFGFAQPILWGLQEGWSVADIAQGLAIRECTVIEAVECFGPAWLAGCIRNAWSEMRPFADGQFSAAWPWSADMAALPETRRRIARQDWAHANWLRARMAANARLNQMGEM